MDIILATNNPDKELEVREIFSGSPLKIITLTEAGIEGEAVEDGETLQDNAVRKAVFAHVRASRGMWVMADDTGIFINALGGRPGVHSKRWAGEGAGAEDIRRHTLEELRGVTDRFAYFETVVAVMAPDTTKHFFRGRLDGWILEEPRSPETRPTMPYASIFRPYQETLALSEMTIEYENRISHRGKAFRGAREFLESQLK